MSQSSTSLLAFVATFWLVNCVIADTIYGWGYNDYGQLGIGSRDSPIRTPTVVSFYKNKTVTDLQISYSFHIARTDDGSVYVAGNNYYGCLGLGTESNTGNFTTPIQNPSLTNCDVRVSRRNANAICGSRLYGWGEWAGFVAGQSAGYYPKVHLANNNSLVNQAYNIYSINEGIFVNGSAGIAVAGTGATGKLAIGSTTPTVNFQSVAFFNKDVPVARIFNSQSNHSCAVAKNSSLYCWGENDMGQLGVGDFNMRTVPTIVQAIEAGEYWISQVVFGTYYTLALTCGGKVLAWGEDQYGFLGDGLPSGDSQPSPQLIGGALTGLTVVELVTSTSTNFARTSDNRWFSWGAGYGGTLGTGSDVDVYSPTEVPNLKSMGINHIVSGSVSRSFFGWNKQNVFTTPQFCPTLFNECLSNTTNSCSEYSICADTDRAYFCSCPSGFTGNGWEVTSGGSGTGCVDIDECATGTAHCDGNSTCINTIGSYICNCSSGFHGNGLTTGPNPEGCTMNANQCATGTAKCSVFADCTDMISNYTCVCKNGFVGNGFTCTDINECAITTNPVCGSSNLTTCTNTNGSYICSCKKGFTGVNGTNCTDVNECALPAYCSPNATCVNTVGSATCTCNADFTGNGINCTERNVTAPTTGIISTTSSSNSSSNVPTIAPSTGSGTANSSTGSGTTNSTGSGTTNSTGSGASTETTSTGTSSGTGIPTTSSSGVSTGGGDGGNEPNTLDVNTIAPGDTIGPATSSTSGDYIVSTGTPESSSDEKEKILLGVFIGFIGLVIIVTAIIVIMVVRKRRREAIWI